MIPLISAVSVSSPHTSNICKSYHSRAHPLLDQNCISTPDFHSAPDTSPAAPQAWDILQIRLAQAMPTRTRRRIPIFRGVIRGRVVAPADASPSLPLLRRRSRSMGADTICTARSGRSNSPDLLFPIEVPIGHHAALRFRRGYPAVAHLLVLEVLELVFLMKARRGRRRLAATSS